MSSSTSLLVDRRLAPLFWSQFGVAFNDNLFKYALLSLVAWGPELVGRPVAPFGMDEQTIAPVASLLLILPFALFSATAGELSDRYPKHQMMVVAKAGEIVAMILAGAALLLAANGRPEEAVLAMLALVPVMGALATLFGPSKYAILPQLFREQGDLVAANAWIELGTNLAVLAGMGAGTALLLLPSPLVGFAVALVLIGVAGWYAARQVPAVAAESPGLKVHWEPVSATWASLRILGRDTGVFHAVLGISWFWAFAGAITTLLSTWPKAALSSGPGVYALFTGVFAVGVGVGSLLCERLSRGRVEIGLVPIGTFGMSLFLFDMWLVGTPWPHTPEPLDVAGFVARPMAWRLMFDAFGLAASAGIFSVPLYAYVQESARPDERSRVIGANNIANSVLIVLLQGALVGLATQGFDELTAFGVLGVVNLAVAAYMYQRVPDFTLRFVAWVLGNVLYRQRVEGLRNIPESGPALLICNHVSFVDFLIIHGAVWRPIRFVMDREMSRLPLIRFLFAQARVIPITSFKNDPALVEKAMDTVSAELRAGNLVCIFPEGGLTWDGKLMEFKKGMERILERDPVPVVPMALNGLWGSFFSRVDGGAMKSPFRRGLRSEVSLTVGEPVPPAGLTADSARALIEGMWQGKAA